MSACDDFIGFNSSEDWELVIGKTFTAQQITPNSHIPIGIVDLGVDLDAPYLVVVVQVIDGKSTWRYGGEIRQVWNFPSGGSVGQALNKATSEPTQLFINKLQIVRLVKHSIGTFKLNYHPPSWFKGAVIIGWKYTGTVQNFTKDALFELGNKIGIGTLNEPDNISNILTNQDAKINDILAILDELINSLPPPQDSQPFNDSQVQQINSIVTENVSQVSQEITNLSNNLGEVLSGESPPEILNIDNLIQEDFL